MPVQLQPEIYRLIIKALVSLDDEPRGKVLDDEDLVQASGLPPTSLKISRQSSLAKLMRVSKVSTKS